MKNEDKKQIRKVVGEFLNEWANRNFDNMVLHCQTSWVKSTGGKLKSRAFLRGWWIHQKLKYINIPDELEFKPCIHDGQTLDEDIVIDVKIPLVVRYSTGFLNEEIRVIRLIKETKEGIPSKNGEWGVNPISVNRKLKTA